MEESVLRIDKWLWCVRLFKTRTLATDACRAGKVKVEGDTIKPSRDVHKGMTIVVQQGPIKRTVKVIDVPHSRVGPKLVATYMEDLTPPEELSKPEVFASKRFVIRDRGTGRPTKKERRDIETWLGWDD